MKDLNTTKNSLKPIRDDIVAVVIVVSVDVVVFEASARHADVQLLDDELLDMLVLDELVLDMLVLDERVLDMLVLDVAVPWMCTPIYMSRLQIEYMYIYVCVYVYVNVCFLYI